MEILALCLFTLAVLHTFLAGYIRALARRYPEGSVGENFFHLLGEVEIVFGLWAGALLAAMAAVQSPAGAIEYLETRNFTEPFFVFVILVVCATRPVLDLAGSVLHAISKLLPLRESIAFYTVLLTVGPILGSFLTEPAAMTVTALLLRDRYFNSGTSNAFRYATLGTLFVNISIGGTLTPYAAPPVLMVASQWGWGLTEMVTLFGWKGALACLLSTALVTFRFRRELSRVENSAGATAAERSPRWLQGIHLVFLAGIVLSAHYTNVFIGFFLFFLGLTTVTAEHQTPLRLREGLLVAFFLGGLVVLGGLQRWWLEPLLAGLSPLPLYFGAMGLTAITDNAALTYLGSLVPSLSEAARYALVAGAVVGGGLTVIANAPNPAGYSILSPTFGEDGIRPLRLLLAALPPTLIAAACYAPKVFSSL